MAELKQIHSKQELKELAVKLGVRDSWHEPDEQGLRAFVFGKNFDNAGFWGFRHMAEVETRARMKLWNPKNTSDGGIIEDAEQFVEMFLVLYKDDEAVAETNLATLLAYACGTYE